MRSHACFIFVPVIAGMLFVTPGRSQDTLVQDQAALLNSAAELTGAAPAAEPPGGKRVFGVLPNYRTADASQESTTLTAHQKLVIASKDSFDYPLVALGALFAGLGQMANEDPSFGQGMKGFGHRLLTNYSDQATGNLFTEGLFPVMLHEDPRYFRLGKGSKWRRTGYALSRIVVTRTDSGATRFNYSEWLGNAASVALSNTYYPDNRTTTGNVTKVLEQCGTDAISQVLKEFWPDIKQKLLHKSSQGVAPLEIPKPSAISGQQSAEEGAITP